MWKLYRKNLNLSYFSIKEDRKSKAIEVKLNALFKNTRSNSELVQKQWTLKRKKRIDQKSQTTTFCFLREAMTRKLPFFRFWLTSQENLKSKDIAGRLLSETAEKLKMKMSKMSRLFTLEDFLDHNDERHITSFVWLMKTHHQLTYVTYVPSDFIVRKTETLLIVNNLLVCVLKCTSFLKAVHSHNYQDRYAKEGQSLL